MKPLKNLLSVLLTIIFVLFFNSCKNKSAKTNEKVDEPEFISETFEANPTGTYKYVGPDTLPNKKCIDKLTAWRAIVEVVGTSDLLDDLAGNFDFCGDEESHYGKTYAYLVDKDSDTLFIDISGQVLGGKTEDHAEYVTSYWRK